MDEMINEGINNNEEINNNEVMRLPLIPLRGRVLFPETILNFDVGRSVSVKAVENAPLYDNYLFIAAQKNAAIDEPQKADILSTGVIARITRVSKVGNGNLKVGVEALYRAKINAFIQNDGFFLVEVEKSPYIGGDEIDVEAYFRVAKDAFFDYVMVDNRITKEMIAAITSKTEPNAFIDNAVTVVPVKEGDAQVMLCTDGVIDRLKTFIDLFRREVAILKVEKQINGKVRQSIDKSQKEFYLREQLKAIHDELGDSVEEKDELTEKILKKNLPEEVREKALKEISRLDRINPSSPDYSVILNYLDWITDLPFGITTKDTEDLKEAKKILDADHFGLEKVKQRIVEYLAVLQLTKEVKGPILCFVGPPGVGKTSVATSIARALNRKFVRMSLGGVKDEAEIRGHRKTYVGAMPGRIIFGLKNAGTDNPVFLLDEIDKLSSDIHGDPASALLEVLDPEQNATFRDRYLEIPYDLSKVIFITTANTLDTIPYPLLDRMEIIELTGYTNEEKLEIGKRYLVPKQLKQNGLDEDKAELTDAAIKKIIECYTMEAGVRNLEREIGGVIRKIATKVAEHPHSKKTVVDEGDVEKYLGIPRHIKDAVLEKDEVGAATGLAWTSVGGTTLTIEVGIMRGKGEILLTGKLGDVMKESARAAISYIRANAEKYGVSGDKFTDYDIHVHVPEGATPKDGPSAGITMATAILSALTGKTVKKTVAMTGEITLRGKVLPIGGLKEKSLAAYRNGIKTVIIPEENKKDLVEISKEIRKEMKFIPVKSVEEVFRIAINF
ncbi:MAG: endopeptidase La [Clostridia bacterium]|nr:endopeptidase La [Clostridia bacterium]